MYQSFLRQLEEGFALFDHPQFMTSPFFHGLHTFLQLQDFCIKHAVTFKQTLVFGMLLGDLLLELGHLRQAAVAHPKAVLQATLQQKQN